jgi:hypothetical protein
MLNGQSAAGPHPMKKNLKLTLAWFALAFLVTLAAIWQAQVTVAREVIARSQLPPPPVKTRHAVRPTTTASPALDYTTRKNRGLTDQEIGWIVEDFQSAGLDLGIRAAHEEEYLAQRQAQDRWYRDALVEAWSLTPEQSAQVTAKLAELYGEAKASFIDSLAAGPPPIEVDGKWYRITSAEPIHQLIDVNRRLHDHDSSFMPWNLVALPAKSKESSDPFTTDLLLPRSTPSPEQKGIEVTLPSADGILPQIRKLHPAEFKLQLLITPEKLKEIQVALEAN